MRKLLIGLALALLATPLVLAEKKAKSDTKEKKTTSADTTGIIWHRYDEGLKMAREKGKPMLINFTTSWCGYCKKMRRTTFKEPEVIKLLNNDFVSIVVDGDSKEELNVDGYKITERNLTKAEFGVRGYPTYWFLKSDANKIGPTSGYKTADQFLDILYFVRDEIYDKMQFTDYLKNGGRKGKN